MIPNLAIITETLNHPNYSSLFKQPHFEQDKKKSGFVHEQQNLTQVNYKEVSENLEKSNYQEWFTSHKNGDLLNPHVYKQ
jgi:hypothetical protein